MRKAQVVCSKLCGGRRQSERMRNGTHPAVRATHAARKAALKEKFRAAFGDLTDREVAIVRWVTKYAYDRGYKGALNASTPARRGRAA